MPFQLHIYKYIYIYNCLAYEVNWPLYTYFTNIYVIYLNDSMIQMQTQFALHTAVYIFILVLSAIKQIHLTIHAKTKNNTP